MEQYSLSNSDIDLSSEKVGAFLASHSVERREALRIKLTFEEVLLEYQAKLGADATYTLKCIKRFSAIRIELCVQGEVFNPLEKEDNEISGLLAGIGLAPAWSYKNGKNYIVFIPKKKAVFQTVKMLVAIALSVVTGFLLKLLPDHIASATSDLFLTPVTDVFLGVISAVSAPLVFLSVLGSICAMGNMETLGKVGKKMLGVIFGIMPVVTLVFTVITASFYDVTFGGTTDSNFSQILELIYGIVPTNFFEPFITGNALQIIFIAVIFGIAMLMLSSKVNAVVTIVEQLGSIVQTVMSVVMESLPFLVFVLITNMIANGNFGEVLGSYKLILTMILLFVVYLVAVTLWVSARKKVSPVRLVKKALPTFLIALTTASSAAAFSTNVKDANRKLGIDKKLVDFGIPLGQVLYKPGVYLDLLPLQFAFAEIYGIEITFSWLVLGFITNLLLSFATPPVVGGAIMAFTIAFTQLGIPLETMGIVIALSSLVDFPATAMNVTGWQLTLVDIADSLNALNKETLRKDAK